MVLILKKVIVILALMCLFSCNDTPIEVENPDKVTTLEMQSSSLKDSCFYVFIDGRNTYVLNITTNKVIYKIS